MRRRTILEDGPAAVTMVDAKLLSQVLGVTERAVRLRAANEKWPSSTKPVRGGRAKCFPLARLPVAIREAVLARHLDEQRRRERADKDARLLGLAGGDGAQGGMGLAHLPLRLRSGEAEATASIEALLPAGRGAAALLPGQMADWRRRCMQARAAILVHVRALAVKGGLNAALRVVVAQAQAGTLPEDLAQLVAVANARAGGGSGGGKAGSHGGGGLGEPGRTLSVPTLKRWWGLWRRGGFSAQALAPVDVSTGPGIPAWGPALLAAYRLPSKPSVPDAIARMVPPAGVDRPSEGQARRFLSSLPAVERNKGRMGPAALKAIRPFVRRETDGLDPLDIVIADGFTAKHDVAHPIHGRPFAPELTVVRCVATRRVIGWSAGLSESTWTVMDAYADAARKAGLWAIAYTDNGAGFRSRLNTGELAGLQGRLGATHALGRPGNPQARGQIEKGWDRLFIQPAKALPSFRGADMDPQARRRVVQRIEQDLKSHGASPLLQDWADFLRWAGECVAVYNAAPHTGLARIRDEATGKRRHLSPDEAWQGHLDKGWAPVCLADGEADDLFRPHLVRRVRRGEVALFNNPYFHAALEDHHGEEVQVGFDIHDPSRVWVRSLSGVLIAVAEAGGNVRPYFDRLRVERAKRRLRPVEQKRAEILAEMGDAGEARPLIEGVVETVAERVPDGERPAFFASDLAMYGWCAAHPEKVTAHDRAYLAGAAAGDVRLARAFQDHDRRHGTDLCVGLVDASA